MKKHVIVSVIGLIIVIGLIVFAFLVSVGNGMAHEKEGMMKKAPGSMMGSSMMDSRKSGHFDTGLKRILHRWVRLLVSQKDQLQLTEAQLDGIQSMIIDHRKETIRLNAELRILDIEVRELLFKEKSDFSELEKRLRSIASLKAELDLGGARTFEKVKEVLSEEQRKKLHSLFRPSIFSAMERPRSPCMMGEGAGMMSEEGMMGQGGMMKGMMGTSMMKGQSQTGVSQSSLTKTDSQGPVTMKIAFDSQKKTKQGDLIFRVEMDTHSMELGDIDLGQLSVLRTEQGADVSPSKWNSPSGGGHHMEGTLRFPNMHTSGKPVVGPDTQYVELIVKDVGEIAERVFRWDLN